MTTDPKPRPNHRIYLEILRSMTPEQKILKVFELTKRWNERFRTRLQRRFPDVPPEQIQQLILTRLEKRHRREEQIAFKLRAEREITGVP